MEVPGDGATDHFVPCTAGEDKTCQIVDKLSTWNMLLLGSQSELPGMPYTGSQLFMKNSTGVLQSIENFGALRVLQYPELIEWLLRTHRCITSVYLKLSVIQIASLSVLDALRHSSGTKTVILCF